MSLVLKRGRGRPRLNESREFNDSILQLISEFRKRPALFDRNHPMYRDKENTDRLWQEMSEVLQTPISQIKDRTTQLRNRFNIERRRLDAEQGGEEQVKSQWALYEHLTFLNDHIKTRRPLLPSRPESPSLGARTSKRVKLQTTMSNTTTTTSDEDDDVDIGEPVNNVSLPLQSSYMHDNYDHYMRYADTNGYSNGIPTLYNTHDHHSSYQPVENSAKKEIYRSFGNFVSSSLIGMREKDALRLLEKFTKELVQTMNSPACNNDV